MKPLSDSRLERWFLLAWTLVTIWLLACALLVQGEYGDGYQTIVNARYFFGDSQNYYVQRGPLAAAALWPVELLRQGVGLGPLDVRPYHLYSAFLHSVYLYACWLLLRRAPGNVAARLIAFGTAILTVVFYAYGPYLSHDLLPGLLFLLQLFLCHRWLEQPNAKDATLLVLLGAGVTFIKQTYAVFWVAIVVYAILAYALRWDGRRVTLRKLSSLIGLAAASGAISWVGYGLFIGGQLPEAPLLARLLPLISGVASQYREGLTSLFPADLYLRNLHNYGVAAMLMVIPGIVMAIRGADPRMRMIALCWLIGAGIMQIVSFREVRYLAFLSPLTAMLIVPVAQRLIAKRALSLALIGIVLFDQTRGLKTAVAQITSTARIDITAFVDAPEKSDRVFSSKVLSFVIDGPSPLSRDRYHGIYHLTPENLSWLYEGKVSVATILDPREMDYSILQPGDRVYYSNSTMVRRPPWQDNNLPRDIADFLQLAGNARPMDLMLKDGRFHRDGNDGSYVMFLRGPDAESQMPVITRGMISAETAAGLFGIDSTQEQVTVRAILVP